MEYKGLEYYESDNVAKRFSKKFWILLGSILTALLLGLLLLILFLTGIIGAAKNVMSFDNGDYIFTPERENLRYEQDVIYYEDMLVAYLEKDITDERANEIAESVNGRVVGKIQDPTNVLQIQVPSTDLETLNNLANTLMKTDEVIYATYDFPMEVSNDLIDNNPWNGETDKGNEASPNGSDWWAEAIDAYSAWDESDPKEDIMVGIIDNGFDLNHEEFFDSNGVSKLNCLVNYRYNSAADHGTHVAGLIGASDNNIGMRGVCDDAQLLCADWTPYTDDKTSSEYVSYLNNCGFIEITKQMVEAGAKVVNNSWGTCVYSEETYYTMVENHNSLANSNYKSAYSQAYESYDTYLAYMDRLAEKSSMICMVMLCQMEQSGNDFIIVESSGNGYDNGLKGYDTAISGNYAGITEDRFDILAAANEDYFESTNITFDTIKDHLLIVGAVKNEKDSNGNYYVTDFSNYGDTVDICAPGDSIYSCGTLLDDDIDADDANNGYEYISLNGTSMSAPIVAGSASLVWAQNPDLTCKEVKEILITTSKTAVGVTDEDRGRIYPMLDLGKAVDQALNPDTSNGLIAPFS